MPVMAEGFGTTPSDAPTGGKFSGRRCMQMSHPFIADIFQKLDEAERLSQAGRTEAEILHVGYWCGTLGGKQRGCQARSVVGGVYLKMLEEAALWKKWSSRAAASR